jgi:hypothetical protein
MTEQLITLEELEVSMLPELQGWKEKQQLIVNENPFIAITDNKSFEEAKKSRTILVSARTTIEKQEKLIASKLKDVRTKVSEATKELIDITLPSEEKQQEEVKRFEAIKETERLEKERKDQERKDLILSKIDAIYLSEKSKVDTLTFENIVDMKLDFELNLFQNDEDFEEFDLQFASKVQLLKQQLEDKIKSLTEKENQRVEAEKLAKEKAEFEAQKKAKEEADKKDAEEREAKQKAIDDANEKTRKELEEKQKASDEAEAKRKADLEAEFEAKQNAADKANEALRLENERKANELAEVQNKLDADKKAKEDAEYAEAKRLEDIAQKEKEDADAKVKAKAEAKRIEELKPTVEKLHKWVDSFEIADSPLSEANAKVTEIMQKFKEFQAWSKKEVSSII